MSTVSLLLNNLPALWSHEGVTANQRESLVQEVFDNIIIDGNALVAVKPKATYQPLFAAMSIQKSVGYSGMDFYPISTIIIFCQTLSEPILRLNGIVVLCSRLEVISSLALSPKAKYFCF
jgi:hypothetical protein